MTARGEATAAFMDATRADYGIRLGMGAKLVLRGSSRLREIFPDGCKFALSNKGGMYELSMLNRASGDRLIDQKTGKGDHVTVLAALKNVEGDKLSFGTVTPESVVKVRGGLVIMLPAELPAVGVSRRGKKPKAPKQQIAAAPPAADQIPLDGPAPTVAQPEQQEAPREQTGPQTQAAAASWSSAQGLPTISLREAVLAVNAYKRAMPDSVVLEIKDNGTLRATAEYE